MDWITPVVTVVGLIVGILTILQFIRQQNRHFTEEVKAIRDEFRDERMVELERRLVDIDDQVLALGEFNDRVDKYLLRKDAFSDGWNKGQDYERKRQN